MIFMILKIILSVHLGDHLWTIDANGTIIAAKVEPFHLFGALKTIDTLTIESSQRNHVKEKLDCRLFDLA